jgi:hypothetical protein
MRKPSTKQSGMRACYDYAVGGNLAHDFCAAGLRDVAVTTSVVTTDTLDEHPFWRAFLVEQLPLYVYAGLLDDAVVRVLAADLETPNSRGAFSAAFMVRMAVGVKAS